MAGGGLPVQMATRGPAMAGSGYDEATRRTASPEDLSLRAVSLRGCQNPVTDPASALQPDCRFNGPSG